MLCIGRKTDDTESWKEVVEAGLLVRKELGGELELKGTYKGSQGHHESDTLHMLS